MEFTKYEIIDQLRSDVRYTINRAVRKSDGKKVVIKFLSSKYPTTKALERLNTENTIMNMFDHPNIFQVSELENFDNSSVLIMEDFPGISLKQFINGNALGLTSFFDIAIQLAKVLQTIHENSTIHKNINTENIIINPKTKEIKLFGFDIASVLISGSQPPQAPEVLETSLVYISPEQTGRMNRSLDHRTDLYSIGIAYYEMLVGHCPFLSDDPMELVYSHIAKEPEPPHELNHDVPEIVSKIVLRLLAKGVEDRYQSAAGLKFDLQNCQKQYKTKSAAKDFDLGLRDISDQFHISEKLYGRTEEINQLLTTFDRVSKSQAELLLVAGYSGVGKTRLVNEVQKPILQKKGRFIAGKFDQFKRNVPFGALLIAFGELIRQILAESERGVENYRKRLLEAFGTAGQVIIDVIPEVELLVGKQPAVPELPPNEARNRFNLVFRRFVQVFCHSDHPLCIFLDDLQWVDPATLQWMESVLTDGYTTSLLLIGSYRDNEVSPAHPMMLTLDKIKKQKAVVDTIKLNSLDHVSLNQLIADTLVMVPDSAMNLSSIVMEKTDGNPFFVNQCLHSLYEDGAIQFDSSGLSWTCDIKRVRKSEISDNVVELLAGRIQRLPTGTQNILQLAACIGNHFDLNTLAVVSEQDHDSVRPHVLEAMQNGLLVEYHSWNGKDSDSYKFLHDRVQQAAQSRLTEDERKHVRLQIGRLMLENSDGIEDDDHLFDIAEHLNIARSLITDSDESLRLAKVNLAAAKRAMLAAAYEPALNHVTVAMDLIQKETWNKPSELTLELLLQRAECEHQCANNDVAEDYYKKAVDHAITDMDKARVYEMMIHFYTDAARFRDAYEIGRQAVQLFGVKLTSKFVPPLFLIDIIKPKLRLGRRKISDLLDLPTIEDERQRTAIRLLAAVAKAAYQVQPQLCVAVAAKSVNLNLKYGNTPECAIGYMVFGSIFIGGIIGNHQVGYDFGRLALSLIDKYDNGQQRAEVNFVVGYFGTSWLRSATDAEVLWQIAYKSGVNTGDLFHVGCACSGMIQSLYMRGVIMDEVWKESERFLEFLERVKSRESIGTLMAVRQSIRNLQGTTKDRTSFSDDTFDEEHFISELEEYGSRHFAHFYFINKMQTLYLWKEYEKALEVAEISAGYLKDSTGMLHSTEHHFYHALILAALITTTNSKQRGPLKRKLRKIRMKMKKWAQKNPNNFLHKSQLLAAETCRIDGDNSSAITLYDSAIESAIKYGYLHIQALANELASTCHDESGRKRMARFYLNEASNCYTKWGANAYVEFLPTHYPHLIESAVTIQSEDMKSFLDLKTVMKASQAISGEIVLDKLLSKMMQIVIKNAGAQKGFLILPQKNKLMIEAGATGESDAGSKEETIEGNLQSLPVEGNSALSESIVNYVARTKEAVILNDAVHHGDFTNDPYIVKTNPKSVLCAPLTHQSKLTGILYLENNLTTDAFTSDRLEVLKVLSSQAAISIESARLYKNLEEKVEERTQELKETHLKLREAQDKLIEELESELQAAHDMQMGLMPNENPKIKGFDIAGKCVPAKHVGGDFFHYFDQDGKMVLCLADVTGHGMEAAISVVMFSGILDSHMELGGRLEDLFGRLNRSSYRTLEKRTFVCCAMGELDLATRTVQFFNGGCPYPFHFKSSTGEVVELEVGAYPLGVRPDTEYQQMEVQLEPGDRLIFCSDGIAEADNANEEQLGYERTAEMFRKACVDNLSAESTIDHVLNSVKDFKEDTAQTDDMTCVVIRVES